jgi:ubiquitin-protein ligase
MATINEKITTKRLVGELKDLNKNRVNYYQVLQDETNKFLFYFLLRGEEKTDYEGGYYLGKIELPSDYPSKPGFFFMLTPNGRFVIDKKICLTNSGFHTESWNTIWSIRNMMLGFYSIFSADDTTGIAHIKESKEKRSIKAQNSINYNLANYNDIFMKFDQFVNVDCTIKTKDEIEEYLVLMKKKNKSKKKKKKKKKKKSESV